MVGPSLTLDEITYEDCESKFRWIYNFAFPDQGPIVQN